jgi:hypothetical protein
MTEFVIYTVVALAVGLLALWVSQRPATRIRWKEYRHDPGRSHESLLSQSLDGVYWKDAPVPNIFHQCWMQTQYFSRNSVKMGRCPCGGFTQNRGLTWTGRNSRRKKGLHASRS